MPATAFPHHLRPTTARRRSTLRRAVFACVLGGVAWHTAPAQVTLTLTPGRTMSTLAGSGVDARTLAGPASSAALGSPQGVAYDTAGNLYIADARNHQVTRVDTAGQLTVIAGTGLQGFAGDGGPATLAELNAPTGIAVDANGNVYLSDSGNHRVRRIGPDGTIATVAGSGTAGFGGDGGAATAALLRSPSALAIGTNRVVYIADTGNYRVRKLQADGTIVTVAGSGGEGDDGDGGAAIAASLQAPSGLALLPDGRLLIADRLARRIRSLNADGTISGYSPGPALTLRRPVGLASDVSGTVSIADAANQVVLQGSTDGGSAPAGSGEQGLFTPGAPLLTSLDTPTMIAVRSDGDVAVSDRRNHQVQRVATPSLTFGNVPAGSSSAPQTVSLQNRGDAPLQVLAVNLPGSFALASTGTCAAAPFTLQPAAQCAMAVLFAPAAQGTAAGLAQVRINGAAPQSLLLSGNGTANGTLATSITALSSNGSIVYAGSPVTLTATVAGSLLHAPVGNVTFMDGSNPLAMVALTGSAASFSSPGLQTGQHTLSAIYSGDAVYSTSTSPSVGVDVVPTPDFIVNGVASSYSAKSGGIITVPITLVPVNGTLNHVVQFSATGLPTGATATFSPATLTLGGDAVTVTMTIQLPVSVAHTQREDKPIVPAACAVLVCVLLLGRRRVIPLLAVGLCVLTIAGCGTGFRAGVTEATLTGASAQTSLVVVTATTTGVMGASLSHSASLGLVVSQ